MTTELRKSGLGTVGDLPWGTHFCAFFETKRDLLEILMPYFQAGLENNEYCYWVVCALSENEARDTLRSAIPGVDRYLANGAFEIVPYSEMYLPDGILDFQRVIDRWREKARQALAKGYSGLRATGNTGWLLTEKDRQDFAGYEAVLTESLADQRIIVVCTYPFASWQSAVVFDVAHSHQFAVARKNGSWLSLETPELVQAKSEIKRLNDNLERQVTQRTGELAATNEELKREIAERKRVEELLSASHGQLRALASNLETALEEERIHIAREIHDDLGQALTGLKIDLGWIGDRLLDADEAEPKDITALQQKIEVMSAYIDDSIQMVRSLATELRPAMLDDLGLEPAIEWQVGQFQEHTGISCAFTARIFDLDLDQNKATAVFRILQEALTNVARHACASHVDVRLLCRDKELTLEVTDDGRGITPGEIAGMRSLGLLGMEERAHLLGGDIRITAPAQAGTTVMLRLPLS